MEKQIKVYSLIVAAFLTGVLFWSAREGEAVHSGHSETSDIILPQVIKSIDFSKDYDLAGEVLPLDNFDVLERLDREIISNAYLHGSTLLNIKAQQRFFPLFEKILTANGVPSDFKFLAVAESNLRQATSPAGAKGIWQFMPATAKAYDLEINSEVDERLHVEKSTHAACQLLLDYKKRFGSWTLAAAAYNMGSTRLAREMAAQKAEAFYDLNLNAETSRYVFRIVAIKEILSYPNAYGYYPDDAHMYNPLDKFNIVEVDTTINSLADFAIQNGTTYRMLKLYNPWLLTSKLTNRTGKTYEIKIPT